MKFLSFFAFVTASCSPPEPGPPLETYPAPPEETTNEERACVDEDCSFRTVEDALEAATDGVTVRILPGTYRDGGVLRANRVTIRADGAYLFEAAWEGKASLVVKGDDTTIEGLRCSHVRVAHANGACVRAEGRNITLRNVHFHDAQTGILTGRTAGRVVIEDSTFERLGNRTGEQGNAHGMYIGSVDELVLQRSRVVHPIGKGHGVKSRAARTVIEDSVIASLDGRGSRQIDLPNGGDVVIRGNVLEKGPGSVNHQLIGIGHERGRRGVDHELNQAVIENNTILLDRAGGNRVFEARDVPKPVTRDNVVIGDREGADRGSEWFRDRDAAGLPAYPFLPASPVHR